ncbi:hypothetical protein bsdcttw_34580 [Anaerocolumna chitinilytica]|uniref:Uncharacterized protein n=1 Tax=Anaerocolumna chitinilytica TaxID=1727145 RepID=A0A7I8DRT6_9FIRM|nr:hypothetical protein bsdcttw_34580 [Anaerocolumna chitinilytica]
MSFTSTIVIILYTIVLVNKIFTIFSYILLFYFIIEYGCLPLRKEERLSSKLFLAKDMYLVTHLKTEKKGRD